MKKKKKVIKKEFSMKKKEIKRKSYLSFSYPFMALIFVLGVAMIATIEFGLTTKPSFHPLGLLALITTCIAGASAVKNGFRLKHVFIIGLLCFLAIVWVFPLLIYYNLQALPITTNYFVLTFFTFTFADIIINLVIYVLAALISGAISLRIK